MVIVAVVQCAGMSTVLMSARLGYRCGEADRAAAHKREHAQNHQKSPYQQSHGQNLSRRTLSDNAAHQGGDAEDRLIRAGVQAPSFDADQCDLLIQT